LSGQVDTDSAYSVQQEGIRQAGHLKIDGKEGSNGGQIVSACTGRAN